MHFALFLRENWLLEGFSFGILPLFFSLIDLSVLFATNQAFYTFHLIKVVNANT